MLFRYKNATCSKSLATLSLGFGCSFMLHSFSAKNMIHHDLYTKEAELVNASKRCLCDGSDKDILTKLRLMCLSRGATGLFGLARSFRIMDDDGNNVLGFEEFQKGMKDIGLELSNEEAEEMFKVFDENGDGSVNLTEFILKLRPPMSNGRLNIIDKAFEKLDKNGDGVVTMSDLRKIYSVKDHPKYLSGERTEDEILTEFLAIFEHRGVPDGRLTKEEFINYYAAISASIDNDAYFDLVLRRAYKI